MLFGIQGEYMSENKANELKLVRKKMLTLYIVNTFAAVLVGFGIDGVFSAKKGEAIIEIFNNIGVAYSSIGAGVAIMVAVFIKMLPLVKRKFQLENEDS